MKKILIYWIFTLACSLLCILAAAQPEIDEPDLEDTVIQRIDITNEGTFYPLSLHYVVDSSIQVDRLWEVGCTKSAILEFSYTDFLYSRGYGPQYEADKFYTISVDILDVSGRVIKTFYPVFSGETLVLTPTQPKSVLQLPAGEYRIYLNGKVAETVEMPDDGEEEEIEDDEYVDYVPPRRSGKARQSEEPGPQYWLGLTVSATFFPDAEDPRLGGDTIPRFSWPFACQWVLPWTKGNNMVRSYTSIDGKTGRNAKGFVHTNIYDDLGRLHFDMQSDPDRNSAQAVRHDLDCYGNRSRSWLPAAIPGDSVNSVSDAMVERYGSLTYSDAYPFSEYRYEDYPEGRLERESGPGANWVLHDRAVHTGYLTNIVGNDTLKCYDIPIIYPDPDLRKRSAREFPTGSLSVTQTVDEDGHTQLVFKDVGDRTVLERRIDRSGTGVTLFDTYYLYDELDRLCVVLPPAESAQLPTVNTENAYLYRYSDDDLLIARKCPGADWEYIVYDADRNPVFTQNGIERRRGVWRFSISDSAGRECLTGICRNKFDPFTKAFHVVAIRSIYLGIDGPYRGYGVNGILLQDPQLFSVKYYDNYHFLDAGIFPQAASYRFADHTADGFPARYTSARGAVTGTIETRFGVSESASPWYRVFHYDNRGRLIQCREGEAAGIRHTEEFAYDHLGNVLKHRETATPTSGAAVDVLLKQYTYDGLGRRISATARLNLAPAVSIAYAYDALGRLTSRSCGSGQPLFTDTFAYNLRGWMIRQENGFFSASLRYESPDRATTKPSYSGNIAEWSWKYGAAGTENTYAFTYDALSRLTASRQYENGIATDRFVERGITYDRNGNLLTLQRTSNGVLQDNLTYTYDGNRLQTLSGTVSAGYSYDAAGNMTFDGANGLNIVYNRLNRAEKVFRNNEIVAQYSYLADGTKHTAFNTSGEGVLYLGSLVYRRHLGSYALESASFDAGRFVAAATSSGTNYQPHYFVTDHLGSVRAVVDAGGEVLERNDYYPFGLRWSNSAAPISDNRYRYNGKEEQAFVDVPYIDYGARMYDPKYRISWHALDPLAEKYLSVNPYAFCSNNPVKFVDVDGMDWYLYNYIMMDWYEYDIGMHISTGTGYKYTELTSQEALDEAGIKGRYLGKVVVTFDGSYSERLGTNGYLNTEGAVLAKVTVYGPKGENDIEQYPGFTMTSDFKKFGAIADGEYNVSHVKAAPNSRIPKTHIINNGAAVDCVNGVNPSPKEYDPYSSKQKNKIYVHRSNNSGWAGDNPKKNRAVSSGCLLISGDCWEKYEQQINKHNYKLILRRTK